MKPLVLIGLGYSGSTAVLDGFLSSGKCWSLPNKREFDYLRQMFLDSLNYYQTLKTPFRIIRNATRETIPLSEAWQWFLIELFFRKKRDFEEIELFFQRHIAGDKQIILNQGLFVEQMQLLPETWKKIIVIRHPFNSFHDMTKEGYFYSYKNLLDAQRCGASDEFMKDSLINTYLKRIEFLTHNYINVEFLEIIEFEQLIKQPRRIVEDCENKLELPSGSFNYNLTDAAASRARQISKSTAKAQLMVNGYTGKQLSRLEENYLEFCKCINRKR
ncbi:hypothetical protein UM181_00880 [Alphaproteobacteria bacterium US3C007]|nr:hypothetical protein UM181_00880 [Alphaproteobacteria bacterium US3C007]